MKDEPKKTQWWWVTFYNGDTMINRINTNAPERFLDDSADISPELRQATKLVFEKEKAR